MKSLAAAVALLVLMGLLLVNASNQEAQTFDEAIHIVAGYSYWKTGDYKINVEHPPLAKLIAALPLRLMGLTFDTSHPHWVQPDQAELGRDFLYNNTRDADSILFAARLTTIALTLLLGAVIAWWTWRRFGALAAVTATVLFALDSNFIAHGHYVTTDVPVTCFGFLAAITWISWLASGRKRDLAAAAFTLGLAISAKFSGLYLLPVHALLLAVQVARRQRGVLGGIAGLALVILGGAAVASVTYGKQTLVWLHTVDLVKRPSGSGAPFWKTPYKLIVPNHPYGHGLLTLKEHNRDGHRSYLLGEVSMQGRRDYFPVAFLVKTPAATVLLIVASFLGIAHLARRLHWFTGLALVAYPAAYFAISVQANINIGFRHLLPVYPFLTVLAGAFVASLPGRWGHLVAIVAAIMMLAETGRVFPHHLAFFNAFAGGPARGHEYLLDSNLDWGQDIKKLKKFMDTNGIKLVQVSYFGMADFHHYGIPHGGLPGSQSPEEIAKIDNWVAISVTNLYDVYFDRETYGWLRKFAPVEKLGWSIYVYDLRQSTVPAERRPLPQLTP